MEEGPNREVLEKALLDGGNANVQVYIPLIDCTAAEFGVLLRILESVGPAVNKIQLAGGDFLARPFAGALRYCTALDVLVLHG